MKLGKGNKVDGKGSEEYENAIQQEKKKSTRIEGQRKYMVRESKYPFKSTLKEAGPEKIQTF